MSFNINPNHPVSAPLDKDGKRTHIVCDTNLSVEFFEGAGVSNLPDGVSVFWGAGQDHSTYTISGQGPEIKVNAFDADARIQVGKTLIQRGATPIATR